MAKAKPQNGRRTTLANVAKLAGVHPTTASQVLNQRRNCWASPETRQRVWDAAKTLNYHPHFQARSLRSGQSHSIGFITTALDTARRIRQLDRDAMRQGYTLLTSFSPNNAAMEEALIQRFSDHSVDGLLVYPSEHGPHASIRRLVDEGFPIVAFDGRYHLDFSCPSVGPDMSLAGRLQAEHVLERGRRRICIAKPVPSARMNQVREAAIEQILRQAGVDPPIICEIPRPGELETSESLGLSGSIDQFVSENIGRFDAVIAFDSVASLFIRSLLRQGARVPKDVSVVGLGNSVLATHGVVGLTTVDCRDVAYASQAMTMLMALIRHEALPDLPPPSLELIIREST